MGDAVMMAMKVPVQTQVEYIPVNAYAPGFN